MANLAKLAQLSKRMKTQSAKTHEEKSGLSGPIDDSAPEETSSETSTGSETSSSTSTVSAPAVSAPAASGGGGGPTNVTVNVDLNPLKEMVGRLRDEMREIRDEMKRTREKGMKVEFGDDTVEQFDQIVKHLSTVGKSSRELTEKLVTSLPESRWYGDLINLGREVGEGMVAGGGGGGASSEDLTAIKEQVEMQGAQLTAILSLLQKRG